VTDEAKKYDGSKPRWDLLHWDALEEVVKTLNIGADQYGDHNWFKAEGLSYTRMFAATVRHLTKWWRGERNAPDHGVHHLAHAAACILTLLSYELRGYRQNDDRPSFAAPAKPIGEPAKTLVTGGSVPTVINVPGTTDPAVSDGKTRRVPMAGRS